MGSPAHLVNRGLRSGVRRGELSLALAVRDVFSATSCSSGAGADLHGCPGTPRFAQLGDTYFCAPPGSGFLDFSSSLGRWRSTRGLGFQKAIELAEAVAAPVDVDQVDVVEQPVCPAPQF